MEAAEIVWLGGLGSLLAGLGTGLGALPIFLGVFIQMTNPGYLDPMFQGWGWVFLGGAMASIAIGMVVILRMVKVDI